MAAGLAPAAQGSDGGGSIRIPSSVCGLFGIKPTRGRISGGPLTPDLMGLSTDGPLARTVADAALLLDAMTGNSPRRHVHRCRRCLRARRSSAHASREPGRLRIGRSLQHAVEGAEVHPDCVAAYEDASGLLASLGHEVEDVELPFGPDMVPMFEILWYSMATLAPIDPAAGGPAAAADPLPARQGVTDRGAELLFAQAYLQAVMRPAHGDFERIRRGTRARRSPRRPVPVGYFDEVDPAENFERQKRFTPYTALYNMSGQPAVSVPLHWNADGPADRRHAGRPDGRRGHADLAVRTARIGPPVEGQAPRHLE